MMPQKQEGKTAEPRTCLELIEGVKHRWHYQKEYTPVDFPEGSVILCVGTDRSTGDCLGPMIGTALKGQGVENVYGTLHDPIHATNLAEKLRSIKETHPNSCIIAVDSALGKSESIGVVSVKKGSLLPGSGVGKELPAVGDYAIAGVVNVGGYMEYFVLQNTRLSLVSDMAKAITAFLMDSLNTQAEGSRRNLCVLTRF